MLSEQSKWNRTQRRWIVATYYAASVALGWLAWDLFLRGSIPAGWRGVSIHVVVPLFLLWLILSPGILGGVRPGGLIRPFSPRYGRTALNAPLIELFPLRRRREEDTTPADERDQAVRDHAHYVALSILRLAGLPLAIAVCCAMVLHARWLTATATLGCFALFILAMTLPQAILLWTEPDLDTEAGGQPLQTSTRPTP